MFSFVTDPLFQLLVYLNTLTGNFGLSIVFITILSKVVFLPLTYPALKVQFVNKKKMNDLKPELAALKKKYKGDNLKFAQAQSELFKKHDIKLTAGLLPNLIQIAFLIAFFHVLREFLHPDVEVAADALTFLGFNMIAPDTTYVLPFLTGFTQFVFSLMLMPGLESHDLVPNDSKSKKIQKLNEKETDQQEMAQQIQQQMLFMMPVITGFIAIQFPAGLSVYWIVSTIISIAQQYTVSGWGGIEKYSHQIRQKLVSKK